MSFTANDAALLRLIGVDQRFKQGLRVAADRAGRALVAHTKGEMLGQGVPSAIGEYPAVRTGGILNSIDYEVEGSRYMRFGTRGAFNAGYDYAKGIHNGNAVLKGARPYLTLTVNAKQGEIHAILGRVTWQYIIGGG